MIRVPENKSHQRYATSVGYEGAANARLTHTQIRCHRTHATLTPMQRLDDETKTVKKCVTKKYAMSFFIVQMPILLTAENSC